MLSGLFYSFFHFFSQFIFFSLLQVQFIIIYLKNQNELQSQTLKGHKSQNTITNNSKKRVIQNLFIQSAE